MIEQNQHRGGWARVKVPLIIAFIAVNMVAYGGYAALELWQNLGPGQQFAGTVVKHDHTVTRGEDATEQWLVTLDTSSGPVTLNLDEHPFNLVQDGQQVTWVLDARDFLGNGEGLRSMSSGGHVVFKTTRTGRALRDLIVLAVVSAAGLFAIRLILVGQRRSRDRVASPALMVSP